MTGRKILTLLFVCLGFAAFDARAETSMGVHLASVHVPARDYHNNRNVGLYFKGANWQSGVYRNSIDRTTAYAAYVHPVVAFDLMLGVASGYARRCTKTTEDCKGFSRGAMAPMAGVSYLAPYRVLGAAPRLFIAPGIGKSSTVAHISFEWSLK